MTAVILTPSGFITCRACHFFHPGTFLKTPKQRNVTAPSSAISTIVRDMTQRKTSSSKSVTCNKLWCSQELTETKQTEKSKLKEDAGSDMTYIGVMGKAEESRMISYREKICREEGQGQMALQSERDKEKHKTLSTH